MEHSNITQLSPGHHNRRPANDTTPAPLRFRTPKDILDSARARARAGLATGTIALPSPGEAVNVLIGDNCGYPASLHGTIKIATCVIALDANRILVKFRYGEADPGTGAAWVTLSQITFPNRNADCEVAS